MRRAFAERWIDVYPNKGKSGGAYSSGTYDSNPYILTNFTGTLDSVSTIAHEMGHSLHTWHVQPSPAGPVCGLHAVRGGGGVHGQREPADRAAAAEGKAGTRQMRLYLLNQYLENFKGTVYRQTMFAEFEREAHAMAERGEALWTRRP